MVNSKALLLAKSCFCIAASSTVSMLGIAISYRAGVVDSEVLNTIIYSGSSIICISACAIVGSLYFVAGDLAKSHNPYEPMEKQEAPPAQVVVPVTSSQKHQYQPLEEDPEGNNLQNEANSAFTVELTNSRSAKI